MSIHEAAIRILHRDYPKLQTAKFRRSICTLEMVDIRSELACYPDLITHRPDLSGDPADDGKTDWAWYRKYTEGPEFRRIPDAYFLDFNTQMAVVFEVEDTSRLNLEKLGDYYGLYFDHLDPLGWGLALISVNRWGQKTPVPFFDYVFSEMLTSIPDRTMLGAVKASVEVEHQYTIAACKPYKEWSDAQMFEVISGARQKTRHDFWRAQNTIAAFEHVLREK